MQPSCRRPPCSPAVARPRKLRYAISATIRLARGLCVACGLGSASCGTPSARRADRRYAPRRRRALGATASPGTARRPPSRTADRCSRVGNHVSIAGQLSCLFASTTDGLWRRQRERTRAGAAAGNIPARSNAALSPPQSYPRAGGCGRGAARGREGQPVPARQAAMASQPRSFAAAGLLSDPEDCHGAQADTDPGANPARRLRHERVPNLSRTWSRADRRPAPRAGRTPRQCYSCTRLVRPFHDRQA